MRYGKIIGYASDICWWQGHIGEVVPILEVYEPTGFIKISLIRTQRGFENQPYQIEGWIPPEYFVEIDAEKCFSCENDFIDGVYFWFDKKKICEYCYVSRYEV